MKGTILNASGEENNWTSKGKFIHPSLQNMPDILGIDKKNMGIIKKMYNTT